MDIDRVLEAYVMYLAICKAARSMKVVITRYTNKEFFFLIIFTNPSHVKSLTLLNIWVFGVHLINLGHINSFEYLCFFGPFY